MQRCPNCHTQQIDGTIFCSECGATLPETEQALQGRSPTPEEIPDEFGATPDETRLTLQFLRSGRQLRVEIHDEMLVGRKDAARGIEPDIDLSGDGGYDAGVSRRHAIVIWRDGRFYIEDLGSANGTFVNGTRVEPQTRVPLQNGDELRCGTLDMRVTISP